MLEKNLNIVGPGKKAEDDDNDEGRDEKKIDERAPIFGVCVCFCSSQSHQNLQIESQLELCEMALHEQQNSP